MHNRSKLHLRYSPSWFQAPSILLFALVLLLTSPAFAEDHSWARFGGPQGDFQATQINFKPWGEDGPQRLWRIPIGSGYAGVVGDDEAVFATYFKAEKEVVLKLDPSTGTELWNRSFSNTPLEGNLIQFGRGPNATPLLLPDRLITLGYNGELRALSRATGEVIWEKNLTTLFEAKVRRWGFSASPILHEGSALVAIGGKKHGLAAFAPEDGSLVWGGPATTASYATPLVIEVAGQEQILYFSDNALIALDPKAPKRELWKHSIVNKWENHSTMPLWNGQETVWAVSQLKSGARALSLPPEQDTVPKILWKSEKIQVHYWNTLLIDSTVYASIGPEGDSLAAVDLATGKILWREKGYPQLNFLNTGSGTLALEDQGILHLLDLNPDGMKTLASFELSESATWTAPSLIGHRLFIRDEESLHALALEPIALSKAEPSSTPQVEDQESP